MPAASFDFSFETFSIGLAKADPDATFQKGKVVPKMYRIEKNKECLFVKFLEDFDYNDAQVVIRHLTSIKEYPHTNDIWMIGERRAHIRLGELESMVHDFQCRCPRDSTRTKTAIVVAEGLTKAVIELWVKGLKKRVSFEIRIFDRLEHASSWLGIPMEKVA